MNTIVRWSPMADMVAMNKVMTRAMAESQRPAVNTLPLDLTETDGEYTIRLAAPGLTADAFDITLEKNVLTVKAEVKSESDEGVKTHVRELRYGSFSRAVRFPVDVNGDEVSAGLENGILSVHVPKVAPVQPKKIAVNA